MPQQSIASTYCVRSSATVVSKQDLCFWRAGSSSLIRRSSPHLPFHQEFMGQDLAKWLEADTSATKELSSGAESLLKSKRWFWEGMQKLEQRLPGAYQEFLQSYAACVAFADHQMGRLFDALQTSGIRENTIVVLLSDHGFHLGEKEHIEKFALWEKTTHIPMILIWPGSGVAGQVCSRPVDSMCIYPTLLDLCDIALEEEVDGVSIRPLLEDPDTPWSRPAVMTYLKGNHAVRSERWRYIRYSDGSEELYDHENDPSESDNLAGLPQFYSVKELHRKWLPASEAAPVSDLRPR